jgi:tetratricopeptide (TPR) repeat protein
MSYSGNWLPTVIGTVALVATAQAGARAKSATEVGKIAEAITVKISYVKQNKPSNGSGILLQKQGNLYTVLTAAHVVRNVSQLTLTTADDQQHQIIPSSVKVYAGDVDLAIVKFRSNKSYQLAELGDSNKLARGMELYVAGFPAPTDAITESTFMLREGKVSGIGKKAYKGGYALSYSNDTLSGMSGGPVLNEVGQVVGIHGKGDREQGDGPKTGFNLGIPIARFADTAGGLGVATTVARTVQSPTLKADDYFLLANQKYQNKDYQGALADYSKAISLDPNYTNAYVNRGFLQNDKLNDIQGALADFNKAIALDPNYASYAYAGRGFLKYDKLNDTPGALADFNKTIALDPNNAIAYVGRGFVRYKKFNDVQGALADSNKAIALDPNYANAYTVRGLLKYERLNDTPGALADCNKAITLDPNNNAIAYVVRGVLKYQKLNDIRGVLADLNTAISLEPKNIDAYYNRGDFYYAQGDLAQAQRDFQKVTTIVPDGATGTIAQGVVALINKQPAQAIQHFDRAQQLDPNFADLYKYRGRAYQQQNQKAKAIRDWRKAAELYKKNNSNADYRLVAKWLQTINSGK